MVVDPDEIHIVVPSMGPRDDVPGDGGLARQRSLICGPRNDKEQSGDLFVTTIRQRHRGMWGLRFQFTAGRRPTQRTYR